MSAITPYLCVADCRAAIAWYAATLGAEVTYEPIVMDDGRVGHVELGVGGGPAQARWMMSDPFDEAGVAPPAEGRGACVTLHLEVPDVDAVTDRVTASGTVLARGPEDTDHGRTAVFTDPFGHRWMVNGAQVGQPA